MTISRYWRSLKTSDFDRIDREQTVIILPLAAIEQHGPHLPLDVDLRIGEGIMEAAVACSPEDLPFLILPAQAVGYSVEHSAFPGTLSCSPTGAIELWTSIAGQVAGLGFKRFILFNSHGGNSDLMRVAARELRVQHEALTIAASWYRMVDLAGYADAAELEHGIHGGLIETSVMLHLAPDSVDMSKASAFTSYATELNRRHTHLTATGNVQFGWMAQDLNSSGAVGDASLASAEIGQAIVTSAARSLLELVEEAIAFDLGSLADRSA
ncbi:MAG: creatininase family protein [Pseudomonadota bacterium]|nr:creatininase family protein [Pseudomonadota bacterium]